MTTAAVSVNVLNASYEPLGATKLGRALALVLRGDAVVEEADPERLVRHKNGHFPWPLVIRLLHYVKVPLRYGAQPWSKAGVLKRDGHRCGYCGKPADTVDHIHPQSKGGGNTWENTVACCFKCNQIKGDKSIKDARLVLNITPTVPTRVYVASTKPHRRH